MFSNLQGKSLYRVMSACCGSAFMLYGYDAGVLGGIQATPQFHAAIGNPQGVYMIPIIASIYNLAAAIMSLAVTLFGMSLGRRKTILLGDFLICVGAALQASTYSVAQIIVGRIICGCGIGCIASAVPTYMAEMSLEAKERGPEVCWQLALLISGVALAYWIDLGFVAGLETRPWLWRIPLALQACFAIFSAGGLIFLPDTPRWYYYRGRIEEADACLARLHALPVQHEHVQAQKAEVLASINEEDNAKFNLWMLFWDTSDYQVGRRLRTSFLILFAQQFLGINMLVYFATSIFLQLGYSPFLSGVLAAVMNTVFAIASYPPVWYIEKIGRRAMMLWTALGCGVCMLIYVILTTLEHQTTATGWCAVAFILLYMVVFGFGWLGPPWIYGPEIAPLKYRHVAGGLAACGEWLSTWVMVFGGGSGIEAVGPKIFIWPLICCFLAAAYVYWWCPETTGRTLEEIDYLFAKKDIRDRMDTEGIGRAGGLRRASVQSVEKDGANSSDEGKVYVEDVKHREV
ncbi:general substrate transporter [Lophiotrema nucula]|uniref:General substrate transporter n=1 Tax=Lophiotrema nucula TaxID=690887 RepID=A0A6A5YIT4_9PLEO|nr:general substrate transporter [Lophiotrema nucula]